MKTLTTITLSLALWTVSNSAWACAVCGSQEEKAAGAYLSMTIFLSLLPLGLIGGVGYWLWRRYHYLQETQPDRVEPEWKTLALEIPLPDEAIAMQNQDASCTP